MSQIPEAASPRVQGGSHSFAQTLWPLLQAALQVCLLSAIWIAMDVLRQHFGWSMPAGLIGFGLLAVGLFSGLVKARWLQGG